MNSKIELKNPSSSSVTNAADNKQNIHINESKLSEASLDTRKIHKDWNDDNTSEDSTDSERNIRQTTRMKGRVNEKYDDHNVIRPDQTRHHPARGMDDFKRPVSDDRSFQLKKASGGYENRKHLYDSDKLKEWKHDKYIELEETHNRKNDRREFTYHQTESHSMERNNFHSLRRGGRYNEGRSTRNRMRGQRSYRNVADSRQHKKYSHVSDDDRKDRRLTIRKPTYPVSNLTNGPQSDHRYSDNEIVDNRDSRNMRYSHMRRGGRTAAHLQRVRTNNRHRSNDVKSQQCIVFGSTKMPPSMNISQQHDNKNDRPASSQSNSKNQTPNSNNAVEQQKPNQQQVPLVALPTALPGQLIYYPQPTFNTQPAIISQLSPAELFHYQQQALLQLQAMSLNNSNTDVQYSQQFRPQYPNFGQPNFVPNTVDWPMSTSISANQPYPDYLNYSNQLDMRNRIYAQQPSIPYNLYNHQLDNHGSIMPQLYQPVYRHQIGQYVTPQFTSQNELQPVLIDPTQIQTSNAQQQPQQMPGVPTTHVQ